MFTHKEMVYALLKLAFNRRHLDEEMRRYLIQEKLMKSQITEKGKAFVMDYLESMGCI